jgi:hypothetical protein
MPTDFSSGDSAVAFLVSAGICYEIIAKDCSSPQTTEINAGARAATLMKWVNIGVVESAVFVAVAMLWSKNNKTPILVGGVLAAAITYVEYLHARSAGLASSEPATEDWGPAQ